MTSGGGESIKETAVKGLIEPAVHAPVAPIQLDWPFKISRAWAWGESKGQGVKVAVIDSGIDDEHPAIPGGVQGWVAVDVDGRGNPVYRRGRHPDGAGHGTACGGIIKSIAPAVELFSIQVLGEQGHCSGDNFIGGIRWALDHGMDIINMSLGTSRAKYFGLLHDLADEAYFRGSILVVAASNRPVMSYPALYASVIGVAAVEEDDPLTFYYNTTPPAEFMAGGINVRVAQPGGRYAIVSGNSMACPRISAICALIRSRHPGIDTPQLKVILRELATPRIKRNPAMGYD